MYIVTATASPLSYTRYIQVATSYVSFNGLSSQLFQTVRELVSGRPCALLSFTRRRGWGVVAQALARERVGVVAQPQPQPQPPFGDAR